MSKQPVLHLIRHGQGLHNVPPGHYDLPDPLLTPQGEAECLALRSRFFGSSTSPKISLVETSPMSRAIQSAYIIFQPLLEPTSTVPFIAVPDAQEGSTDPCDIGADPDVLAQTCAEHNWPLDLSLVKTGWNDKITPGARYSASSRAIFQRARDLRLFLRDCARSLAAKGEEDVQIALVAHGGFMHYLTGDWEGAGKYPATGWTNCEVRSYVFDGGVDGLNGEGSEARLVELETSRKERGLEGLTVMNRLAQRKLYEEAMTAWEGQGLQNHSKVVGEEDGEDDEG